MQTKELNLQEELADVQRQSNESIKILTEMGFVVDTSQWLTIKRYAERYDLSMQVVTNWIGRGVIPSECTMELPELNGLRLVKDQPYK